MPSAFLAWRDILPLLIRAFQSAWQQHWPAAILAIVVVAVVRLVRAAHDATPVLCQAESDTGGRCQQRAAYIDAIRRMPVCALHASRCRVCNTILAASQEDGICWDCQTT